MAQQTHQNAGIARVEWILFSCAFAAGAVDIIGFARLGGVFASAMTGNLALLAYHAARGNTYSAIGSVIALLGFAAGCVGGFTLRRGRSNRSTINLLLGTETGLLLLFAVCAFCDSLSVHLQIVILSVAMGLQAVVSQMISLSTIVFTTTLTRLVGTIIDAIAARSAAKLREIIDQVASIGCYLAGALLEGVLIFRGLSGVVSVPLVAVAVALAAHGLGGFPGAANLTAAEGGLPSRGAAPGGRTTK
jgi:uncharacterized membrane protein YoaK (UPF0700 family)